MHKNTKKTRKIQIYERFAAVFLSSTFGCVAKNILLKTFESGVKRSVSSTNLSGKIKKNRIKQHISSILKKAFLEENTPIFSYLSYDRGTLTYQFSQESVSYFEKSKRSHDRKKKKEIKRAEKYLLLDPKEYRSLSGKHSKNIYLKLLNWLDTNVLFIGRNEMKSLFGNRKNKDMKKDVLKPSFSEINAKTSLKVDSWKLDIYRKLTVYLDPFGKKKPAKIADIRGNQKKIVVQFLNKNFHQHISFSSICFDVLGFKYLDEFVRIVARKKHEGLIYDLEGYVFSVLNQKVKQKLRENKQISKSIF